MLIVVTIIVGICSPSPISLHWSGLYLESFEYFRV